MVSVVRSALLMVMVPLRRTMVMAFSGSITRYLHYAIHVIRLAALNLNLDRAVTYFELMLQLLRDGAKHILAAAHTLLLDTDVTTTTNHARTNGPDMKVVDRQDARYGANCPFDRIHVHSLRNAFQQYVDGFFQDFP